MGRQPPAERLFTPAFVLLTLAELAYFLALGVVVLALPLYATGPVGTDAFGAGVAFGAFAVTALLLRPLAGRLADEVGRRPLLLGGALLCSACLLLLPLTEQIVVVVTLRLLQGVAEAAFFVAGMAALADIAPASRVGEALSYNSLGLYLGLALGPVLAEQLIDLGGFDAAWMGAAGLALVAALLAAAVGETRVRGAGDGGHGALVHRPAVPAALGFLAALVAAGGFLAFAALHAREIGLDATSLPLLVYGTVVVAGRVLFARLPDRLPPYPLGAGALAVVALGLGLAAAVPTPAGFLTAAGLVGLGVTFVTPAFFSAVFASAAPHERGAASATASAAIDLGMGLGPITLGFVAGQAGFPAAFAVGAGVAAAGGGWTLVLARRRREPAPAG